MSLLKKMEGAMASKKIVQYALRLEAGKKKQLEQIAKLKKRSLNATIQIAIEHEIERFKEAKNEN